MLYIELVLIGISLSMDAFSLALCIGLNNLSVNKYKIYSIFVGIFHFIMPIIGYLAFKIVNDIIYIPNKLLFIGAIIFIIIGILIDKDDKKNIINPFIFAFAVSIDSFTIGLSLNNKIFIIAPLIFSIISFSLTYIGFYISNTVKDKINNKPKIISLVILLIILLYNVFK